MHELALMGDILSLVEKDVKERNFTKVNQIHLIVGDLSNAMPDALEMAFEIYRASGIPFLTEDSKLVIEREEAKARCVLCNEEYIPDQRLALCPHCGMPTGKIISGETLQVRSYEGS
ncbi:Hydrogenase expression/synthesis HypA [[Clostridium] ultunense Esp]|uniref:hydrogenase maturation nickel metallochaperone HypA/HybF n=1 Tax=Thermicanus aegyptius TaxID=94009 RepID=UPI0002B6F59F|nr:hydrogenase maturation nickel metallochaperone HypA [Thermicanus aegyptius]MBE3553636.1 hydrogenase maturation nickel metallochaperone HypA [Thermicanus sp.]CCQ97302.1 Hydrogenase expression/synthesis HypA [[Clostridium] ultunense Esp]